LPYSCVIEDWVYFLPIKSITVKAQIVIILFLVMTCSIISPIFAQEFVEPHYTIRGADVLDFELDGESSSLIITLDGRARGEIIITLPRYLIDAKIDSEDTDFEILVSRFKINSFDEKVTLTERIVTIPFKKNTSEIIIIGTHVLTQVSAVQTSLANQIDNTIQLELKKQTADGTAKLLVFSNTKWTGALQSSTVEYTEINGNGDKIITFGCESTQFNQGSFSAKIQKMTENGFVRIVAIQNQQIITQGASDVQFEEVFINGNCYSSFVAGPGGCLIATATYGTELAPQVQLLREIRDESLLQTEYGTNFMNLFNDVYYSFSPIIADYERENPIFKEIVKIAITPMISSLSILNYVDMDSESTVLGYGIFLIILNGMMYVGIPVITIVGFKKRF
jgi:hypothetical protein